VIKSGLSMGVLNKKKPEAGCIKREISEKRWIEAHRWVENRITARKCRMLDKQRPNKVVPGSSKRLAGRFYLLKTLPHGAIPPVDEERDRTIHNTAII
jgi:hypothetical protein